MAGKARSRGASAAATAANAGSTSGEGFTGDVLWIGRHSADEDILVFDPAEADGQAEMLSFYSLTQLRRRTFPRAVVLEKIQEVVDEVGRTRAEKDYGRRDELQAEKDAQQENEDQERAERQKAGVIEAHRRHMELHGIEYNGVEDTAVEGRRGRRTKCHACGIALDDFAGTACGVCRGVLCSCGACGCGSPVRAR